jgi:hypothetical protein
MAIFNSYVKLPEGSWVWCKDFGPYGGSGIIPDCLRWPFSGILGIPLIFVCCSSFYADIGWRDILRQPIFWIVYSPPSNYIMKIGSYHVFVSECFIKNLGDVNVTGKAWGPGALQRFDRHQALWSSWTSPTNRPWRFYPWAPETTWPEPSASCHDSGQSESIGSRGDELPRLHQDIYI